MLGGGGGPAPGGAPAACAGTAAGRPTRSATPWPLFTDGLGFLPYSNGVHDSLGDQPRRRVYRECVANGELPAGYATEDGVGLHYVGTELHEAVAMRDGARAWWVEPSPDGGYHDEADPSAQALTGGSCASFSLAAGMTGVLAGSRSSQTRSRFRAVIAAARTVGLGTLGV